MIDARRQFDPRGDQGISGHAEASGVTIVVLLFVWTILDFAIYGFLLGPTYAPTYKLWRPMLDINIVLAYRRVV